MKYFPLLKVKLFLGLNKTYAKKIYEEYVARRRAFLNLQLDQDEEPTM